MNITLSQLLNAQDALKKILNYDLPVSVSYNLRKLVKATETELVHYEQERIKLCERYGQLNEDKSQFTFEPEKAQQFNQEIGTLLQMNVEVTTTGIDVDKLLDSDLKMSAVEMAILEPFFKS